MLSRVRTLIAACSLLTGAIFMSACAHSQSASTPASGLGLGTVSSPPPSTSLSAAPWTNPAPTSSSPMSEASLTNPMDAAMVLCSRSLSLEPCGLITTGMSDMLSCFAACQTQIQTITNFSVERAAIECASSVSPGDDSPRECTLDFPPTAALDVTALHKACGARCKEITDAIAPPGATR